MSKIKFLKRGLLRVGVYNNFNFSDTEITQLKDYENEWYIFVNSNAYPKIKGPYPAIITLNPYLTQFVKPHGDLSVIKAVRVKYVTDAIPQVATATDKAINWAKDRKIPIIITPMRFRRKDQLLKYTIKQDNYVWIRPQFHQKEFKHFKGKLFRYCEYDKGCLKCQNCPELTHKINTASIFGINLSKSGLCKYNCPECYAKYLQKRMPYVFDRPVQNRKMLSKTHK